MVDKAGNLLVPDRATFFDKNIKVFQQDFRIFVDTTPSVLNNYTSNNTAWWTDCEVKVIDMWGNLIYFTTTIALENSQVSKLHPQICDKTPKVFAWLAVGYNSNGGCWGERKELTNFTKSIGASIGSAISGIWIYPSINSTETRIIPIYTGANQSTNESRVWGEYVRSVFNNPDNTILVWRQTAGEGETYNGNKLWRPARLEYYGDFKEVNKEVK
jgi:hypothetical protein